MFQELLDHMCISWPAYNYLITVFFCCEIWLVQVEKVKPVIYFIKKKKKDIMSVQYEKY